MPQMPRVAPMPPVSLEVLYALALVTTMTSPMYLGPVWRGERSRRPNPFWGGPQEGPQPRLHAPRPRTGLVGGRLADPQAVTGASTHHNGRCADAPRQLLSSMYGMNFVNTMNQPVVPGVRLGVLSLFF